MKACPKCNGRGTVGYFHIDHFVDIECDRCHGQGEVSETDMTNEEWLHSLNTEQLAEWINNIVDDGIIKAWMIKNNCCGDYLESVKWWLKQPRTPKE